MLSRAVLYLEEGAVLLVMQRSPVAIQSGHGAGDLHCATIVHQKDSPGGMVGGVGTQHHWSADHHAHGD